MDYFVSNNLFMLVFFAKSEPRNDHTIRPVIQPLLNLFLSQFYLLFNFLLIIHSQCIRIIFVSFLSHITIGIKCCTSRTHPDHKPQPWNWHPNRMFPHHKLIQCFRLFLNIFNSYIFVLSIIFWSCQLFIGLIIECVTCLFLIIGWPFSWTNVKLCKLVLIQIWEIQISVFTEIIRSSSIHPAERKVTSSLTHLNQLFFTKLSFTHKW